jgi:NAD+-dependent protein deacetylase sirtuin 5
MLVAATDTVEEWLFNNHVDLILVIGTSGVVYPAAGYAWSVKMRGGKVAVFNVESGVDGEERLDDWMFEGKNFSPCVLKIGPCEELLPEALGIDVSKLSLEGHNL